MRIPAFQRFAWPVLVVVAGAVGLSIGGPLNPPAGPVASTHKTLTEIEPRIAINAANTPGDAFYLYKITQPGSYYFTGNITGVAAKNGIGVETSNVTIDMMGFTLRGVAGSLGGISTTTTMFDNLSVRNGNITGWGQDGLDLSNGGAGRGGMVERVHASGNGNLGIRANGSSVVSDCTASGNGGDGIAVFYGCLVTGCAASFNTGDGIQADSFCRIVGNACDFNGALTGDSAGIHVVGIHNRVEDNQCAQADRGIDIDGADNYIVRNLCSGNTVNWAIANDNLIATVINRTINNAAGFSGNGGVSTLTTVEASANFSQ
jgi:hypothetical protein